MPIFLNFDDPTFVQRFEDLLNSDRNDNLDVNRVVIDILTSAKISITTLFTSKLSFEL